VKEGKGEVSLFLWTGRGRREKFHRRGSLPREGKRGAFVRRGKAGPHIGRSEVGLGQPAWIERGERRNLSGLTGGGRRFREVFRRREGEDRSSSVITRNGGRYHREHFDAKRVGREQKGEKVRSAFGKNHR